jgi:hypothetical protein
MPPDGPPDYSIFIVLAAAAALLRLGRWLWRTCRLPAPPGPVADRVKDTLSTVAFGGFIVLGPAGMSGLASTLLTASSSVLTGRWQATWQSPRSPARRRGHACASFSFGYVFSGETSRVCKPRPGGRRFRECPS